MPTRARVLLLLTVLSAACGGGSPIPDNGGTPTPPPGLARQRLPVLRRERQRHGRRRPRSCASRAWASRSAGRTPRRRPAAASRSRASRTARRPAQARPDTLPAYFTAGRRSASPCRRAATCRCRRGWRSAPATGRTSTWPSATASRTARARRGEGYRDYLRAQLRAFWGRADIVNDGAPGTRSNAGRARLPGSLSQYRTAYVLILYGTNDWNEPECRNAFPCYTVDVAALDDHQTRRAPAPSRSSARSRP